MPINNQLFIRRHQESLHGSDELNYYIDIADELYSLWNKSGFLADVPDIVRQEAIFCITGYFEDICSDLGLWRSFISLNRKFYSKTLPFYETPKDYVDYELNPLDVRFLLWYVLSVFPSESTKILDPWNQQLCRLADLIAFRLDECYEEAPSLSPLYNIRELDFHNDEDADEIMHFGSWLFWKSYLLYPVLEYNLPDILQGVDTSDQEAVTRRLSEAQMEFPSGPLALYLREWMYMIINHKLPAQRQYSGESQPHNYYIKFTEATGGERLRFFSSYQDMNRFFIDSMGWEDGTEHLANLKNFNDFTLFVSPDKGMLVARDVARCINAPGNHLFDKDYAGRHSFDLLTVKGKCPCDLLRYSIENGWLNEAKYPESKETSINKEDADFLARCFLQLYYRD